MWVIQDIRWTATVLLMLIGLMVVALGGTVRVPGSEDDWLVAMMQAVLVEQANEGPLWGTFAPYIAQLEVVRGHLSDGNTVAVYTAMNRLMDMLEQRENEIPSEVADRLFEYCYLVTPAKYHDVSRHIDRFIEHQYGQSSG